MYIYITNYYEEISQGEIFMAKNLTMEQAIEITDELNTNDKADFKQINQILETLDEDLWRLLFDVEFANTLTYLWELRKQTISGKYLAHYTQTILISDMISILFRIWDDDKDVNSLSRVSAILNKNHTLKSFIINRYPCDGITDTQAQQIIEQVSRTHKHKLLQHIKKYRTERIGHNLQSKSKPSELFEENKFKLGSIMIYSDLTLKYASDLKNIILGKIIDYSKFPGESTCALALKELKTILSKQGFVSNSGIRRNSLEYTDDWGLTKQILCDLKVNTDLFL